MPLTVFCFRSKTIRVFLYIEEVITVALSVQHHAPLRAHCIQGTSIVSVLIMERIIEWYCDDCHIAITLFKTGYVTLYNVTSTVHKKRRVSNYRYLYTKNCAQSNMTRM